MKRRVLKRVLLLGVAVLPALGDEAAFIGTIVYEQSATGGEAAKAFTGLAAKRITVHLGESGYRQDEEGGLNEGSVIARAGSKVVLRLDHGKKTSERGSGMKLDDLDAETKKFMAGHFETPLKDTGVTEKIAGYDTRKFKVGKSPFVRPGAVAQGAGVDLLDREIQDASRGHPEGKCLGVARHVGQRLRVDPVGDGRLPGGQGHRPAGNR